MAFTSPPDPASFRIEVWKLTHQIPKGRVATYGMLAKRLGPPTGTDVETYAAFGARWVGGALNECPADVPWQRVINSQGKISLPGETGKTQRERLEAEGVEFDEKGRVDLKRFGWKTDERAEEELTLEFA